MECCKFVFRYLPKRERYVSFNFQCSVNSFLEINQPDVHLQLVVNGYRYFEVRTNEFRKIAYYDKHGNIIVRYTRL